MEPDTRTDNKAVVVRLLCDALDEAGAVVFVPADDGTPDAPDVLVSPRRSDELYTIPVERQTVESVA